MVWNKTWLRVILFQERETFYTIIPRKVNPEALQEKVKLRDITLVSYRSTNITDDVALLHRGYFRRVCAKSGPVFSTHLNLFLSSSRRTRVGKLSERAGQKALIN